jgi:membrane associated rhomboid family serine protease
MSIPARDIDPDDALFRKKIFLAMVVPGILVSLMWIVKITEGLLGISFSDFGIYPLTIRGLKGVLFSPFIHADFSHLFNNTLPLFLLGTALFYFYSDIAFRVLGWTYLFTGLFVWFAGREAWHIGASGLVYGLASFLFFSGIIRQHFRLIALSLLIVFLYGSMVWGLFPGVYKNLSWESHMLGFVSGILLAIWFRKMGPQRPEYQWMDEDDEGEVDENESASTDTDSGNFENREHESTRSN